MTSMNYFRRALYPALGLILIIISSNPPSRAAAQNNQQGSHEERHSIVSISVCASPDIPCVDTAMPILAPDGTPINGAGSAANPYGGMATLTDEHSTILPPGTIPGHSDYLFFVATRTNLEPNSSGVTVLTGGSGPNQNNQWTLDFSPDFGLYAPGAAPGSTNGQILVSAMAHAACPAAADLTSQDPTFDLNYADSGTVFVDPTNRANKGPGSLLMVYEGTNRCVGIGQPGGTTSPLGNNFYSTIGIATSTDYGHTWPVYISNFNNLPLPNPATGPQEPYGAFGSQVCMGNDCTTVPPTGYGRYAVLSQAVTLTQTMKLGANLGGLPSNITNSEPSAFVDDVHGGAAPFVYVVTTYAPGPYTQRNSQLISPLIQSDLSVARAQLNGGAAALKFFKWNQGSFNEPGLGRDNGGIESPIFPTADPSLYLYCLAPEQTRDMGAISYVEKTQQYLLTFVCSSPSEPSTGAVDPGGNPKGAAWFYSTLDSRDYDLSRQDQWSLPAEIQGSWSPFANLSSGCNRNFNGWYPTLMSEHHAPGHLDTSGYIFYMSGCTDTDTPGGRQFSTRKFSISTR